MGIIVGVPHRAITVKMSHSRTRAGLGSYPGSSDLPVEKSQVTEMSRRARRVTWLRLPTRPSKFESSRIREDRYSQSLRNFKPFESLNPQQEAQAAQMQECQEA
ncbi:TPA: hypothetical protein ACH3X1_016609 [Trebouxia sp. C0004]